MNCTGKRCIMQHGKVDPATCQCVSYCPQATPPQTIADYIRAMNNEELAEYIHQILETVNGNPETCPSIDFLKLWLSQEVN